MQWSSTLTQTCSVMQQKLSISLSSSGQRMDRLLAHHSFTFRNWYNSAYSQRQQYCPGCDSPVSLNNNCVGFKLNIGLYALYNFMIMLKLWNNNFCTLTRDVMYWSLLNIEYWLSKYWLLILWYCSQCSSLHSFQYFHISLHETNLNSCKLL